MRRVLCIWFPNWPIQRLCHAKPELKQRSVLLYAEQGNSGLRVTACSSRAASCQARVGMPLAEAWSVCRGDAAPPIRVHDDPRADRQALRQLALDCQRYTPLVGLEEVDSPESLWLDIAGCEHLHGGERGLMQAIFQDLRQQGYDVRIAAAETLGAAWAVAHYGSQLLSVAGDRQRTVLQGLPIPALRLSASILQTLQKLDLVTIQELQRLPRSSLPARFGAIILRRLDQAFGDGSETFTPEKCAEPIAETWTSEEPLLERGQVTEIFSQLLQRLLQELSTKRAGILDLVCSFRAAPPAPAITLQLLRPTLDAAHLRQLFALRCEQQDWPNGIHGLRVEIARAGWLREIPRSLFDDDAPHDPRAIEVLMERLTGRLGSNAVTHPFRVPEPLPEEAYRLVSWFDNAKPGPQMQPSAGHAKPERKSTEAVSTSPARRSACWCELRQRPWHLLSKPRRLHVTALFPAGPPQRIEWNGQWQQVARCWGPERIETGWWRERDLCRDYYRVEIETGLHWWVFQDRHSGRWFLHGWF